jgi:putative ABC transport system permease protein
MRIQDTVKLATRMFKTRPARTWLTILGIGVGIAAVVVLVGLGYGLQGIILEKIVFGEALLSLNVNAPSSKTVILDKKSLDEMAKIEHVQDVAPMANYTSLIKFGNLTGSIFLRGVNPNYFKYAGVVPVEGALFGAGETNKVVLSTAALKLFELEPKAIIGKRVTFKVFVPGDKPDDVQESSLDKEYEVAGVVDDASSIYAFISMSELASKFQIRSYESARVKVDGNAFLTAAEDQILKKGFIVTALSKTVEQANKIFSGIQIVLAIFGGIALVVSAIGMFNTMTVTLMERTNEIGIMRTIGGSPTNIKVMFLSESMVMGFLGGVVGIAIGVIGGTSINFILNSVAVRMGGAAVTLFKFPLPFLTFIAIFGAVMGFLTGVFPAKRAASLNPLDAIRYK